VSEWWTYRPSDFLMFSPRIYWRLFESLNESWWPAQLLVVPAGLAWLGLHWRRQRMPGGIAVRAAALCLAGCWAVVAWSFLLERFAPINWIAADFAAVFALQAAGLVGLALAGRVCGEDRRARRLAGTALGLWALLGHPLLAVVCGRAWQQAEVFGLAPEPTVIGTLAFLLLAKADAPKTRRLMRTLWIVPLGWCAVSAATLATMGAGQAWVMLGAATLAVAPSLRR
jgi:hypothetical protein